MANLHHHFGIALISLLPLNYNYAFRYTGSLQDFGHRSSSLNLTKLTENLSVRTIASLPPWQQKPETQSPYVLPPWGLTVKDFVVTRQMPLSSGQRELLLSSPSTGSEQQLLISLPNSSNFQIYGMAFTRVLAAGDKIAFQDPRSRSLLQNFQVRFNNNKLAEVVLADGTKAEFHEKRTIIKSPAGQVIENFNLSDNALLKGSGGAVVSRKLKDTLVKEQYSSLYASIKSLTSNQSQKNCENEVVSTANQISSSIDSWSRQMAQSSSDRTKAVGWAIGHSSEALKNSIALSDSVPNITCRPPVKCEERRISGGSEIRTDLFSIPQGKGGSKITIQYDFYEIPDSVEMYYDRTRILSVGPSSGQGNRTFNLPASAQQVGITIRGNNDPNTKWWYEISCAAPVEDCSVINDPRVSTELLEARKKACRLNTEFATWKEKETLDACPCTLDEARRSIFFEEDKFLNQQFILPVYHPGAATAFRSRADRIKTVPSTKNNDVIRPGQQCTYDKRGKLITAGTAAGTPDAFSPSGDISSHKSWDVTTFNAMFYAGVLEEYYATWTPNNANRCSVNNVGPPTPTPTPTPTTPAPRPVPAPALSPPSVSPSNPVPTPAPTTPALEPVPAPPWDNRRSSILNVPK